MLRGGLFFTRVASLGCVLLPFLFAASGLAQDHVGENYEGNPLAIVDVTVIDVTTGTARPNQVVVIRYGKIDHLKPAAEFETPGWMTEVSGQGRYLIPGLWDAHVHLSFWDEPETSDIPAARTPDPDAYREVLGRLAAWGVTSVRDMGGDLDAIDVWREQIEKGEVVGPAVIRAGPYVDGPKQNHKYRLLVTSADEGRSAAHSLKARGVDFLKIHSQVPPEALSALAQTAGELDLPFAGHVPYGTSIDDLIDLDVSTIEHADAFFISRLGSRQGTFEEWKAAFQWHFTPEGRALLHRMAASRTWFTPTLTIFDSGWDGISDPWAQLRGWYREVSGLAHREGVPFLAGTDLARKSGPIQPGIGLHRELEELVKIGLTPADALRAATLNPALAFGREHELGGIEPGKIANVVLLKRNPLEDITHTRTIEAVVLRGRLLDAGRLSELRDTGGSPP